MTTTTDTQTVYLVTLNRPASGRFEWGTTAGSDKDSLTFYATDSTADSMVCLFLPESDPRHVGMWSRHRNAGEWSTVGEWSRGLPDWAVEGQGTMYGWHVQRFALAAIEPLPADFGAALTMAADVTVPEFVNTTFGAIPIGTVWANVIPDSLKNEDHWNDTLKWVKVNDDHYCTLGQTPGTPVTHEISADYAVTIRNSAHVPVTGDNSDLHQRIADLESAAARKAAEFEAWKARASEIAVRYANANDLCGEFDRCMAEIGLECDRSTGYRVTVSYTFTVDVPRGESVEGYLSGEYDEYVSVNYPDDVRYDVL